MANHNPFKVTALAAAIAAAGAMSPAYALFTYEEGDFKLQLDTTVSAGASWRASDIDYRYVGQVNALAAQAIGENPSGDFHPDTSSMDNGDLNWKKGSTFSEVVKASFDLEINYKNYGAFFRGKTFYDNRIINGDGVTHHPVYYPSPENGNALEPNQSTGTGGEILDAFVWADWWVADRPLNVRLGKQVISWGEGLFFANGINTINPVDVNALLTPGSELKEALIPVEALFASFGITDNLSVEAFYQFKWRETIAPDCGTFFSTSDLVGPGCYAGFYAGGREAGSPNSQYVALPRGSDIEGSDDDQYGIAFRYFIEPIQTEVALYHIRYNSRLPLVSGTAGDFSNPVDRGTIQAVAYGQRQQAIAGALGALYPGYAGITDWEPELLATDGSNLAMRDALIGIASLVPGITSLTTYLASTPGSPFLGNPAAAQAVATQLATAFASQQGALFLPYGEYNVDYPDDIRLWGASFNTNIDFGLPGGETAVAGEISYRENQPMQIEDAVTLSAAIGLPSQYCADEGFDCYQVYEAGDYMPGYVREEFWQAEVAFIHFFDRILGAERWTAILDIAYNHATIPDKQDLLLNSSYGADVTTPYSPAPLTGEFSVPGVESSYPTANSWGYRMRFAGDYSNVVAGINLRPSISFNHDVKGVTPGPTSNFLEDRKSVGLALEADYLNTYVMKVGYTDYFGAEPFNQLSDRDFYSLSVSASF